MKKLFIYLFIAITSFAFSQNASGMKSFERILQTDEIVKYFNGMFNTLGIHIEDNGEKFTIVHNGENITFSEDYDESNVDFVIPLKTENISNMVSHAKDGSISRKESWKILAVLFTPMTIETLKIPVLSVNWRRKLAGVEDLTHVYLMGPEGQEAAKHTLIYIKGQWLVLSGLHGDPRRTYRMNPEQALLYQKKIFSAIEKDSFFGWMNFSSWYKKWRKTCSVTHS